MNNVISFVMVGTNDLEKSNKFYEPIMKLLGLKQVSVTDKYIGFGHQKDNEVKFYITKPHNKEKASFSTLRQKSTFWACCSKKNVYFVKNKKKK